MLGVWGGTCSVEEGHDRASRFGSSSRNPSPHEPEQEVWWHKEDKLSRTWTDKSVDDE